MQIHEICRPNAPIACLPTTPKSVPKFHPITTGTPISTSRFLIPKRLNFMAEQPSKQHRQSRIQPIVKASSTCELDNSQPLLGPLFGEKQNQPLVQRITKANLGQLYWSGVIWPYYVFVSILNAAIVLIWLLTNCTIIYSPSLYMYFQLNILWNKISKTKSSIIIWNWEKRRKSHLTRRYRRSNIQYFGNFLLIRSN